LEEVIFNLVRNAIEAMNTTIDRDRVLRLITQPHEDAIAVATQRCSYEPRASWNAASDRELPGAL